MHISFISLGTLNNKPIYMMKLCCVNSNNSYNYTIETTKPKYIIYSPLMARETDLFGLADDEVTAYMCVTRLIVC